MFNFFKKNIIPKSVYLNDVFLKETNEELKVSDKFEEKYVVYQIEAGSYEFKVAPVK